MNKVYNNYFNSFFKYYHHILDQVDDKIGRRAAIVLGFIGPHLISQIAFIPGLVLHACNVQRLLITAPIMAIETIAYFGAIFGFQKKGALYRKQEIEQIILNSQSNSKKALIIEAADWSGGAPPPDTLERLMISFVGDVNNQTHYRFNLLQLAKTHSIQHIRAHSESQLNENLDRIKNQTIDLIWIRGHGNQQGIYLNKNFFFDKTSISIEKIAIKLQNSALCILSNCNVGRGESNFAKVLSASFSNTLVCAPQNTISSTYQDFTANFFPLFYGFGGLFKVPTRFYHAGTETTVSHSGIAEKPLQSIQTT